MKQHLTKSAIYILKQGSGIRVVVYVAVRDVVLVVVRIALLVQVLVLRGTAQMWLAWLGGVVGKETWGCRMCSG